MKKAAPSSISEEILEFLDCLKVGVYVTDGEGNTLFINDESCKIGGLTKKDMHVGKNMRELVDSGFIEESVSLEVIKSGKEEKIIQNLGDGTKVFVTGSPLFKDGKIQYIISTEIDITETANLRQLLKIQEERTEKYETEIEYLRNKSLGSAEGMIASSMIMQILMERVRKVAGYDTTVLLTGESGTGKEVLANFIFKHSDRVGRPFIKVNCAAIPENLMESEFFGYEKGAFTGADKNGRMGFFEIADGGTLFLDEIGALPIHMQSKLLRALQEKEVMRVGGNEVIPVDVRIIAATNMDLRKAIAEGKFREDLYYRLNIVPFDIPPLWQRRDDIEPLVRHFIEKFSTEYKVKKALTLEAVEALKAYNWPGNVRELRNVTERLVVSFDGAEITKYQVNRVLHVSMDVELAEKEEKSFDELVESYERQLLMEMMGKHKKAAEVCRLLNINKSTLSRKLRKYNI